ncbi:hypothetical protein E2C01_089095 [Portunus trituberculatus]|uniref:Ig-like domain-containing protein n=1 Tax=Portunus trituberculatus TaxID=210409 RepID=A0A5B7JLA8_PORTR|nr:hypothetical protein [Portunus trituberculatus]
MCVLHLCKAPLFSPRLSSSLPSSPAVPPRSVEIEAPGSPRPLWYRPGQEVLLNCTARGAKPRTTLVWEVNGKQVRHTHLYQYTDRLDKRGRVTSTLGLRWRAPEFFDERRAVVTCRASVGAYSTSTSDTMYLDLAATARYNHYSSCGCRAGGAWAVLGLGVLVLFCRRYPR